MERPDFSDIKSGKEFNRWYWLKSELVQICKMSGLTHTGYKFLLRDRIMYALDNEGALMPMPPKQKKQSKFDWANEDLELRTLISDNVSFGPNFRSFLQDHIGNKFVCHSDFMDWVKANVGKTLGDAVEQWHILENRKNDPTFKRNIAAHNMLAQYVRDYSENNAGANMKEILRRWKIKKQMPTEDGFVRYAPSDLNL